MTEIASGSEVDPMAVAHGDMFDIRAGRNCMGMKTFEYSFCSPVDVELLEAVDCLGAPTFPIGLEGGIFKIDVPGQLLVEGILGLRRLRITLRLGIDINLVRAHFENVLAAAFAKLANRHA